LLQASKDTVTELRHLHSSVMKQEASLAALARHQEASQAAINTSLTELTQAVQELAAAQKQQAAAQRQQARTQAIQLAIANLNNHSHFQYYEEGSSEAVSSKAFAREVLESWSRATDVGSQKPTTSAKATAALQKQGKFSVTS
jgi:hypothetical protein